MKTEDFINAKREFIEEIKTTKSYQTLTARKYRNPSGYYTWDKVCGEISMEFESSKMIPINEMDTTRKNSFVNCHTIVNKGCNTYWVGRKILESIENTETPNFVDLPKLFNIGVFLFPENYLKDFEGWPINWVSVYQRLPGEEIQRVYNGKQVIELVPVEKQKLVIVAIAGPYTYSKIVEVDEGLHKGEDGNWDNTMEVSDKEHDLLDRLADIVFQLMLVLSNKPDLVTEQIPKTKPKQTKKQREQTETLLNPIWIGREYNIKYIYTPSPNSSPHSSPQTHWRRGHWRRVPVGEKGLERKWVWINPTLVNP
jgi:hypothetical protein